MKQFNNRFPKLATVSLGLMLFLFVTSCQEDSIPPIQEDHSATTAIEKIETSYVEGSEKVEGYTAKKKVEYKMSEKGIRDVQEKVRVLATQLEERHQLARTIFGGYDVGVVPNTNSCPSWSEKISIFMDNEDSNPATSVSNFAYGSWYDTSTGTYKSVPFWKGTFTIDSNKNTLFVFCRVDGRDFGHIDANNPNYVNAGYGVLKLGAYNVNGNYTIVRHFDNEDNDNRNSYSGDIYPNISDRNTTLYFNYYEARTGYSYTFPYLGFEYGVLGKIRSPLGGSTWYIDDEDSSNANWMTINYNDGTGDKSSVSNGLFYTDGSNTKFSLARVQ